MIPIITLLIRNNYSHYTHFSSQHLFWGLKSVTPWRNHLSFMGGVKSIKRIQSIWDWEKAPHSVSPYSFLGRSTDMSGKKQYSREFGAVDTPVKKNGETSSFLTWWRHRKILSVCIKEESPKAWLLYMLSYPCNTARKKAGLWFVDSQVQWGQSWKKKLLA